MSIDFELQRASLYDHSMIQNMARFFLYEMSRYIPLESSKKVSLWSCDDTGMYNFYDLIDFFTEPDSSAYKVIVENELAGFVLTNKFSHTKKADVSISEFFIAAKFQRKGLGTNVACKILNDLNGTIEISTFKINKPAVEFWRNLFINNFSEKFEESEIYCDEPIDHKKIVWILKK